jgi:hypothetical protein
MRRYVLALLMLCTSGLAYAHGPYHQQPRVIYYGAPVYSSPPVVIYRYETPRFHRPPPHQPSRYAWRDRSRAWAPPPQSRGHGHHWQGPSRPSHWRDGPRRW